MQDDDSLLSVRNMSVRFHTEAGTVHAASDVSFDVARGETVCIVGESGSGKTVTSEAITRLIPQPPGEIEADAVEFQGEDLLTLPEKRLRQLRGGKIGHVFQNPQSALNPVYSVGRQVAEAVRLHRDVSKDEAKDLAIDLLDRVGIPKAADRYGDYPHEFSGGQKQRVVIAIAIAGEPDLLIADEPTTALDVTIQAQILRLLRDIQDEFGMGILLITHDLGVVAEVADRVVVMYAGNVMEQGSVFDVFENPSHPYTRALLECLPGRRNAAEGIGGTLPDPTDPPEGCRFAPRCPYAVDECRSGEKPPAVNVGGAGDHVAACVYYQAGYDASVVRDSAIAVEDASGDESARTDGGDESARSNCSDEFGRTDDGGDESGRFDGGEDA